MKNIVLKTIVFALVLTTTNSCFKDLDTSPIDKDILTSENFYKQDGAYKAVLAKIYAGLATTGQEGPAGQGDLGGIDEGFSSYLRQYWYQQELTTDEAVVGWADATIKDFHDMDWTPADVFINAFYNRIFYQIGICNEFLRQTSDEALNRRNTSSQLKKEIQAYKYEVRFMRALSYWHALDEFRNVPFITEEDEVGAFNPRRIEANQLFKYIESELLDIENKIATVRTNEYARADQGAVWMLLAKLYLNAKQYTGEEKFTECLTYSKKVINGGYTLEPEFAKLFLADNDHNNEIIFPIAFDGLSTQTWGGTTFIIRAGLGGNLNPLEGSGVKNGWQGTRTTKQIVEKFGEIGGVIVDFFHRTSKPQVYIFGDFQENKIDENFALTDSNGDRIYKGYQYFEDSNATIKIAPYPSIDPAYGDSDTDGVCEFGGNAIPIGDSGFYYIEFNDNDKTYKIEKREWVASGSALSNDIGFEYDVETGYLKLSANLYAGDLYFTTTGTDAIKLGDTDGDGVLEESGENITITDAGPVDIFLDLRKEEFIYKISSTSYDRRGIFGTTGQSLDIDDISDFNQGYAVLKFKNITSTGEPGSNTEFPDTDFPLFRLADAYLMASEAILRGATGGTKADAVEYFNKVRARAYKSTLANLSENDLNLQEILDERAREFMWECHRRTDLVRFGQFTTDKYLWQWKGGIKEGQSVGEYRNIFPIPSKDVNNNSNLIQNPGY